MNDKVETLTVCWLYVMYYCMYYVLLLLLLFSAECAAPFSFTQLAVHLFRVNSTVIERKGRKLLNTRQTVRDELLQNTTCSIGPEV